MAGSTLDLLEIVLKECARTAPAPLYPVEFVQATGIPRPMLDVALDHLRLGGLLRLTEWVHGKGQGYTVTEEGQRVAQTPALLDRLRRDGVEPEPAQPALQPVFRTGGLSTFERGEAIRQALLNDRRPIVTQFLIFANIGMFLAGLILAQMDQVPITSYLTATKPDPKLTEIHLKLGALHRTHMAEWDQWWRLLAHSFVHYGLLHLFLNMYFLYSVGPIVERVWGPVLFGWLYFSAGLGGGCAMVLLSQGLGAGASGALCGLLAAFLVWVLANRSYLPPALASSWTRSLLINVVLIAIVSSLPGVSAAGHFGGGLTGAVATLPFLWFRYEIGWKRLVGFLGMIVIPMVAVGVAVVSFRTDARERFLSHEVPVLLFAEKKAINTFNNHALPMLNKTDKNLNLLFAEEDKVRAALTDIASTQTRLKQALNLLEDAGTNSDPQQENVAQAARHYLGAWLDFYQTFAAVLRKEVEWTQATRDSLLEKNQEISKMRKPWDNALRSLAPGN